MNKFNVGDRVRVFNVCDRIGPINDVGTVIRGKGFTGQYLVEFDNWDRGHDAGGIGKKNNCWFVLPKDMVPLTRPRSIYVDSFE